jgi:hypothetical protein
MGWGLTPPLPPPCPRTPLSFCAQMAKHSLLGDFTEQDTVSAAKLLEVVLQNCRGRVDQWVAPYLQLCTTRLATATSRTLKVCLGLPGG